MPLKQMVPFVHLMMLEPHSSREVLNCHGIQGMSSGEALVKLQQFVEEITPWGASLLPAVSLPTQSLMHKQGISAFPKSSVRNSTTALGSHLSSLGPLFDSLLLPLMKAMDVHKLLQLALLLNKLDDALAKIPTDVTHTISGYFPHGVVMTPGAVWDELVVLMMCRLDSWDRESTLAPLDLMAIIEVRIMVSSLPSSVT